MKPLPAVVVLVSSVRSGVGGKSYLVAMKPKDRHLFFLYLVLQTRRISGTLSVGRVALCSSVEASLRMRRYGILSMTLLGEAALLSDLMPGYCQNTMAEMIVRRYNAERPKKAAR